MNFAWRDLVLLLAVMAAIYFVVSLLGLVRLHWRRFHPHAALGIAATNSADNQSSDHVAAKTLPDPSDPPEPPSLADTISDPAPFRSFEAELAERMGKNEMEKVVWQLRQEVANLRDELAEMKAVRRVSPLYAEAATLAQRGFDARGVAEECGISVAEAELVLAMSREDKQFDEETDDGFNSQHTAAASHH